MKIPGIALSLILLAGASASAQQAGTQFYTPAKTTDAPTFVNAEVVRVNRTANTVTFRSESGETTLTVEGEALAPLGRVRTGDKVVLGYRVQKETDGRETRIVTSIREASPTSGEPGNTRTVRLAAGEEVRARVLSYDTRRRRVTVIDESGAIRVLPVTRGITGLDSLVAGANVGLSLGGVAGGGVNVAGVTSLGTTPVFASGVNFPPVNGQLVSFNQRTGNLTLNTATAGQVTFPVGSNLATGLSGLRPGQNLSLTFDVTSPTTGGVTRTGVNTGATGAVGGAAATPIVTPLATITGIQPVLANGLPVQAAGVPGAVSPIAPNTASINAPGLAGTPGAAGAGNVANTAGVTTAGATGVGTTAGGVAGGVPVGTQAGRTQAGGTAAGANAGVVGGANTGAVAGGGGVVAGGPVATSPYVNPVPSIPGVTPVSAAVLPPAHAKQPLSADEVGAQRAQGEADLDAAAVSLAAAANQIDAIWAGFKNQCLRGFAAGINTTSGREWYSLADDRVPTPTDDACRALHADLQGRAQGFLAQLDTVEDAARKADVLPVRVREVFDRHRLR
jgi:hypothetical protein